MLAFGSIFCNAGIGGINEAVSYQLNKDEGVTRCTYLRNLAGSLVIEHAQHCLTINQTPVEIKHQIPEVFGVDAPDREEEYRRGRCYFCGMTRNQKMTTWCVHCERYICRSDHTVTHCVSCVPLR